MTNPWPPLELFRHPRAADLDAQAPGGPEAASNGARAFLALFAVVPAGPRDHSPEVT